MAEADKSKMACDSIKCVIMGAAGVGKSAITLQLMQNRFIEGHDPTIEDSYQKYINVDGKPCRLDILDTAGQEEFKTMRPQYMRQGQGYILVYSVTDRVSYEKTREFYEEVCRAKGGKESVILLLAGNKCDLKDDRKVSEEDGKTLAKEYATPLFYETSAKANINVKEIFDQLIRRCRAVGVEPCKCVGTCKCRDRCDACGRPRNNHKAGGDHDFKERSKKFCVIL
jgi:small GTP-binding protein